MKPKHLVFLIAFTILLIKNLQSFGICDTTYVYTYDVKGNRTDRIIDLTKSATIQNSSNSGNIEQSVEDDIDGINIKFYPNPTKGNLKIQVSGIRDNKVLMEIYNIQGKKILNSQILNDVETADLSKYPSGMYVLKIIIGRNTSEWKIIKD